jgi:uncharacterized protein (DUF983 family)
MRLFYRADPEAIAERAANPTPPKPRQEPKYTAGDLLTSGFKGRCAFCKSRMKMIGFQRAIACRKCGRIQPWAEPDSDTPPTP